MALAVDSQMPSAAGVTTSVNTSPWTWSFTNTAGTVIYLFVQFDNGTSSPTVTATYAGTSMTLLGTRQSNFSGGGGTANIYLFRLTSPATGANNFAISFPAGGTIIAIATAISFSGSAATPDGGTASLNSYNGTVGITWSLTISSTSTGNICIQGIIYGDPQSTFTQTGTLTARKEVNSAAFGNNEIAQFQNSSAGSTNMSFTATAGTATSWVAIGIQVLAPSVTAGPESFTKEAVVLPDVVQYIES